MLRLYYGHIKLVKNQQVFDKWLKKMDSKRREKVLQCKNEADRQRSLLAGILLQFGVGNDRERKQIFYSISHSGDYVICVLSDRKVGIDIENKFRSIFAENKEEQMNKIAKRCFTMGEEIEYFSTEGEEKVDVLLRFWTRKESYSKAVGKGLGMDFSSIDTQKMDDLFWSDWLEPGYYCSLYVENGFFRDMKLQEIVTL